MPTERARPSPLLTLTLSLSVLSTCAFARVNPSLAIQPRSNDASKASDPLRDWDYLPAQIGGIVGAYAVSLVLVAILLLALSKKRRDHLASGLNEAEFDTLQKESQLEGPPLADQSTFDQSTFEQAQKNLPPLICDPHFNTNNNNWNNFTPASPKSYIYPSPISTIGAPGVNPYVDQKVVAADKTMAQSHLEEMYKHVLEHEEAKMRGVDYQPTLPAPPQNANMTTRSPTNTLTKKGRSKPAGLTLVSREEEKTQSRTSSLLSVLRSPRKKPSMKALSISSPIMTPQSATFPRHEFQEMSAIPPRHYAPPPPPPLPTDHIHFSAVPVQPSAPITPNMSPESSQSIDERIGSQLPPVQTHTRNTSHAQSEAEAEPTSASSDSSQSRLVGLPSSPKPGSRFPSLTSLPSLPASPKPGQTFQRPNAPSAVRTNGALPLRSYEPALNSPSITSIATKQTTFERRGPLSPGGGMTPFTATAVPYSPYQPFTPCVPMTPSLVTKEDRKRMKRLVPKTPTMTMVRSEEDVW